VTIHGQPHRLPDPFLLLATTYPADEDAAPAPAEPRDDRFMFQILVRYPTYHDEFQVAEATTVAAPQQVEPAFSPEEIIAWRKLVRAVQAPPHAIHYLLRLVRSTRVHEGENPDFVYEWVASGAGPRAVHFLTLAAKTRAAIYGRPSLSTEDVRMMAPPVLRHRIITNRNAHSTGVTVDRVINRLLSDVPERLADDDKPPEPGDVVDPQDWSPGDVMPW